MQANKLSTVSNSTAANNNSLRSDMLLELLCKGEETGFKTLLLRSGTDANTKRLLKALKKRSNKDIVELLVEAGANVNLRRGEYNQWTPLHFASRYGCTEVAESLIKKGADINARNASGCTPPLHADVENEHEDFSAPIDTDLREVENLIPLYYASRSGCTESAFQKRVYLSGRNSFNSYTPLHAAIANGHKDIAALLISSGADINLSDDENWTPLYYASFCGYIEVAQSLIKKGADLNARNSSDGDTSLHAAILHRHRDISELLISSGADVNISNNENCTPLHFASRFRCTEMAEYLIKKGADLNAKNSDGQTPLQFAIAKEHNTLAELLISSGADINLCNDENWTPLYYASWCGYIEVAQLLIKKGADLNARKSSDGNTPLHAAITNRHTDIVELLICSGADINLSNAKNSCTPFSFAVQSGYNVEGMRFFIENGAYVEPIAYSRMMENPVLKESILQDIKICSQSIINKFNYLDLQELYKLPIAFVERLPPIDKLKIVSSRGITRDVEQEVERVIGAKGHCNLTEVRPIILSLFCVKSLIKYFDGIKAMRGEETLISRLKR